jgi:hypothetical protein
MCSIHIDESATCVDKCTAVTSLCTFFLKSLIVCLTIWATGARCTVLKMMHSSRRMGTKTMFVTVAVWRFMGYKYLLLLVLITISQFFFLSCLGFTFHTLRSQLMEDKRGTKHARSPSKEGSPSPAGAKTSSSAPSKSPPPLTSPLEVSSRCPRSPVWEKGGSSGKAPVVDLSSSFDEGDLIADVSRDEEFTRRLFGDLNCDFLGPPSDSKIIILSDSNKE